MPILKRKIAAILRRTAGYTEADKYLHYKNITLDLEGYRAFAQGRDIDLTAKEFEVLREVLQLIDRLQETTFENSGIFLTGF